MLQYSKAIFIKQLFKNNIFETCKNDREQTKVKQKMHAMKIEVKNNKRKEEFFF